MISNARSRICCALFLAIGSTTSGAVLAAGGRIQAARAAELVAGPVAERVDRYLTRVEALGYSGAALVAQRGQVVLRKGYGQADRASQRPVTPDTVFSVGSVSKQFTGAAIMKLVDDGRLSTDDPITRFLDNVPPDKQRVTVHQLLTHTAGLADTFGDDFDTTATKEWLLGRILASELVTPPGQAHLYSNAGYSLLGMIIEEVSGIPYEQYLYENLFAASEMDNTGYLLPDFAPESLAVGYRNDERWGTVLGRPMLDDGPSWNLRANGGIHSTLDDMFRWHQALDTGRILTAQAQQAYEYPWVDEGSGDTFYGYGWVDLQTDRDTRLLWHSGGNGIFSADARRYVDEDTFVFVTSSIAQFEAPELGDTLDAVIFGGDYTLPPAVVDLDSAHLERVVGRYQLRPGDSITLAPRAYGVEATAEGCWAQYLLAGGTGAIPDNAAGLVDDTLTILLAASRGDFGPLRTISGSVHESTEDSQTCYNGMQQRMGGSLVDAEIVRCVPFPHEETGVQLKIIVAMQTERMTLYRWLRWHEGRIVGYGFGEVLAGGPERLVFHPVAADGFAAFTGQQGVISEFRVERTPSEDRLVFGIGDDRVFASKSANRR